jgi:hypothetical protein
VHTNGIDPGVVVDDLQAPHGKSPLTSPSECMQPCIQHIVD